MSRSAGPLPGSEPVFDAGETPIGRVAGAERAPGTRDTACFLVQLDPRQADDGTDGFCWLGYDTVRRIRRDGIHLTDRLSAILPREDGRRGAHPSARR